MKGVDKVRSQREKAVEYFRKHHKYGFNYEEFLEVVEDEEGEHEEGDVNNKSIIDDDDAVVEEHKQHHQEFKKQPEESRTRKQAKMYRLIKNLVTSKKYDLALTSSVLSDFYILRKLKPDARKVYMRRIFKNYQDTVIPKHELALIKELRQMGEAQI